MTIEMSSDHIYKVAGIIKPSVTQILKSEGFVNLAGIPPDKLEAARAFGDAVHRACELSDKSTLNFASLSLPLVPYLSAWKDFLDTFHAEVLPEYIEKMLYSKIFDFCGTPDRVVVIKDKFYIVDIKSGSVQWSHPFQTAGYQILAEENGIKISGRFSVYLKKTGQFIPEPQEVKTDRNVFLAAATLYKIKKNHYGSEYGKRDNLN